MRWFVSREFNPKERKAKEREREREREREPSIGGLKTQQIFDKVK